MSAAIMTVGKVADKLNAERLFLPSVPVDDDVGRGGLANWTRLILNGCEFLVRRRDTSPTPE